MSAVQLGFNFPPQKIPGNEGSRLGAMASQSAAQAAERRHPGWLDMAFEAFVRYATQHPNGFTTEAVRVANPDIPPPPDKRAWGAVVLRAMRAKRIKSLGFTRAQDRKVHGNLVALWGLA